MNFCSKCGAPLKENAEFCVKCGAKVVNNVVNTNSTNDNTTQAQSQPVSTQQNQTNTVPNNIQNLQDNFAHAQAQFQNQVQEMKESINNNEQFQKMKNTVNNSSQVQNVKKSMNNGFLKKYGIVLCGIISFVLLFLPFIKCGITISETFFNTSGSSADTCNGFTCVFDQDIGTIWGDF